MSFRRYVLEVRGFSLYDYLAERLSPDAFAYWLEQKHEHGLSLDPNALADRASARLAHYQRLMATCPPTSLPPTEQAD